MIQSAVLGSLSIVIGGDVSGLDKAAAKAEGIVGKLSTGLNSQVAHLAGYAAAAAGAGAALAAGLIAKSMETIDVQSKLAARLNGTVAELQSLVHAGDLAGVSQEQLATSIGKMNQKLAEAARTGQGPAYEALQRLGLSAKDFLALPVDERMATLADRFRDLGYNTAQQADSLKQLGVRGQELLSLFEGGGAGIRNAAKDVQAFGVAVSDIDAAQIEAANDAWTTARLLLTGIGNQLSVQLAPLIKEIGDRFGDAGRESHGFSDAIEGGVRMGVLAFAALDREIYKTRVELDELAADVIDSFNVVAGAIPRSVEKATKGIASLTKTGFADIKAAFQNVSKGVTPPSLPDWTTFWSNLKTGTKDATGQVVSHWTGVFGKAKETVKGVVTDGVSAADLGYKDIEHSFGKLRGSLQAPPSDEEWLAWWQGMRDASAATAKAVVDQRKKVNSGSGDTGDPMSDSERKSQQDKLDRLKRSIASEDEQLRMQRDEQLKDLAEFEQKKITSAAEAAALRLQIEDKYRQDLAALVQSHFEDSVATEDELLAKRYEKQLADLQTFENNKTLTVQAAEDLRRKIEEKYRKDTVQLQAAKYAAIASVVDSAMGDITSMVGSEGEKQFSVFKAISAATALVKGYEAIVSAYAAGNKIGGPPIGALFAGTAGLATAAQIHKLMSVTTSGGGGVGGMSTAGSGDSASVAAAAAAPQATQQQTMFLSINGSFFGREQVRELAGKLIDFQNDGGKVVLE